MDLLKSVLLDSCSFFLIVNGKERCNVHGAGMPIGREFLIELLCHLFYQGLIFIRHELFGQSPYTALEMVNRIVNIIGIFWLSPTKRSRFHYNCVRKASKIVVDNWETIKHRLVSTVSLMCKEGLITDDDIHAQLGEILCGKKTGRENDEEIIYFNAVGTGILDLAVTTRCYKKALEQGVGTKLAYWE